MSPVWHELRFRREHRWTPPRMSAYLDSELPARARARLERHTAQCPECRRVLDELRLMLMLLHGVPTPDLAAGVPAFAGAVLRRLHEPGEH